MSPRDSNEPPIILAPQNWSLVTEFLSIARSHAQLESAGVATSQTLLLHGPPGCGKSRLARHIARELDLDLCVARLDGLISSYLGSTSKNIRALFEFASRTPCVLFLDEFDAIAKLRGDTQELGELKRVVNSFIQNLDSLGPQAIVIAATNHEELLDRAIWRRFAYRLELGYPSLTERAAMWAEFVQPLALSPRDRAIISDISEGFSGSDIHETALRLRRRSVTTKEPPDLASAFHALQSLAGGEGQSRRFAASFKSLSTDRISSLLRQRNPKLYSLAAIARLLGVSKTTAFRMTLSGAGPHE